MDLLLPLSPSLSLFKGFGGRVSYLVKTTKKAVFRSDSWEKNRSCAFSFGSFGLEVLSTFFKILTTSENLLW